MSVEYAPGDVLTGSSKVSGWKAPTISKDDYYLAHVSENLAVAYHAKNLGGDAGAATEHVRKKFLEYRRGWSELPRKALSSTGEFENFLQEAYPPQCIDLELASFCDLACPFCYRQFEVTPDKIAGEELALSVIGQAASMGVPSMKFNWRGEPLLHPRIDRYVRAAKEQGILETLINTNGTHLTEARSEALIDAGLDVLILSFDGGTKVTYEKMRPSRFDDNHFETVVKNLANFHEIRTRRGAKFPFIRVQMIMTEETRLEIDDYHALFAGHADEITVTQYTERGGSFEDLPEQDRTTLQTYFEDHQLPRDTPFMVTADGGIFVSDKRLPCAQPFQRLMVSYDGRVGMCCFDWGAKHTIGFASSDPYTHGRADYELVKDRIDAGREGFELMKDAEIKAFLHEPEHKVETLREIWTGDAINHVRSRHFDNQVESVPVCANCTFKDTYDWKRI